MGPKYYAVQSGRSTGVFTSWDACKSQTHGYSGAVYKSFSTQAEAASFANCSNGYSSAKSSVSQPSSAKSSASSRSYSSGTYYGSEGHCPATKENVFPSSSTKHVVYTDGACPNNQNQGSSRAGFGVAFQDAPHLNISEKLTSGKQTNQRAELHGAIKAVEQAHKHGLKGELEIRTDSQYVIKGATEWISNWRRNGWKTSSGTEVENRTEFELLDDLSRLGGVNGEGNLKVTFKHVKGHSGDPGNELADRLAVEGANKK